jgi:hypothetical protein
LAQSWPNILSTKSLVKKILDEVDAFRLITGSQAEGFNANNLKCWEEMIKIRKSALCFTCSGRSEKFFYKNEALIDEGLCKRVVENCLDAFVYSTKYLQAIASIEPLMKIQESTNSLVLLVGNLKMIDLKKAKKMFKDMMLRLFPQILKSENLRDEMKEKPENMMQSVCNTALNLHDITLLQQIDDAVFTGQLTVQIDP